MLQLLGQCARHGYPTKYGSFPTRWNFYNGNPQYYSTTTTTNIGYKRIIFSKQGKQQQKSYNIYNYQFKLFSTNTKVVTEQSSSSLSSLSFWSNWTKQWNARFRNTTLTNPTTKKNRWTYMARVIKYTRIPILIMSVYGLGYQQGIMDYSRDPKSKQEALLDSLLASVGCTDRRKVFVFHQNDGTFKGRGSGGIVEHIWNAAATTTGKHNNNNPHYEMTQRIGVVGRRIIHIAQLYVQDELRQAIRTVKQDLPEDCTEEQLYDLLQQNEQVQFWNHAVQRLEGGLWSFLLVDTPIANAFVSEIVPQKIFVTTAMMSQFIHNDDELALVLAHEVSHLILGHVSEANTLETMLRTLEIVLLSLDPTDGLVSLAIMGLLTTSRSALTAAHSRDNETQADTLGIKLAAMACYDTRRASQVFYKMHVHQHVGNEGHGDQPRPSLLGGFLDTHPPSHERYQDLLQMASSSNDDNNDDPKKRGGGGENYEKYKDTTCASVGTKLRGILQGGGATTASTTSPSSSTTTTTTSTAATLTPLSTEVEKEQAS